MSARRKLGAGDSHITSPPGDTPGVEFGNERKHVLAARSRRVAELGDGEPVGVRGEQPRRDLRRGIDRVAVEADPVALHRVPAPHELADIAPVDVVGGGRREPRPRGASPRNGWSSNGSTASAGLTRPASLTSSSIPSSTARSRSSKAAMSTPPSRRPRHARAPPPQLVDGSVVVTHSPDHRFDRLAGQHSSSSTVTHPARAPPARSTGPARPSTPGAPGRCRGSRRRRPSRRGPTRAARTDRREAAGAQPGRNSRTAPSAPGDSASTPSTRSLAGYSPAPTYAA